MKTRGDYERASRAVREVVRRWDPYGLLAGGCPPQVSTVSGRAGAVRKRGRREGSIMTEGASFSGKVVHVWSKEPARGGVLEDVRVQRLDQRAFLVGRLADDGKGTDPRVGATFWFPVDEVLMLIEYADVQAALAAYAARGEAATPNQPLKKPSWRFWE